MLTAGAAAQISLAPPGAQKPQPASRTGASRNQNRQSAKSRSRPPRPKKPAAPAGRTGRDRDAGARPRRSQCRPVYGAYQRGQYKTAFDLATKRAQDNGDPKAMTMLGELYANALGVKRDYAKAIEWYQRASDGGDREAMFALAMLRLTGRGGPVDREEAAKLLASSAKLGSPKAAYNLALLYIDGQTLPQDLKRAAELLRVAADAGNSEAQYALATFYKEGTGVPKDAEKAVRLLQAAALADNVDAEVEYAIALYQRHRHAAKPGRRGGAAAQGRQARQSDRAKPAGHVLVSGQGAPMDKIEGLKWHIVAKTAGKGDPMLDAGACRSQPGGSRQGGGGGAQMARRQMIRLDGDTPAGHPSEADPIGLSPT